MNLEPLEPVGAVVRDADLASSDLDTGALRDALAEHGVLIFRGQSGLDDAAFAAFLRGFGELAFTDGETHVDGHPDLNVVTNVGRDTPPRSQWHVDTTYVRTPPAYTALRAVQVPARGGATLFTNQYRALDTLPEDLRTRIGGRVITHVVTGVEPGPDAETAADHPIARPHPITGREALYLSTPDRCAHVSGLDDDAAAALVAQLLEHSTTPANVLRHEWAEGDVVMWDNAAVLHRADHDGVEGDRTMHRGMVAGS